jgi:hypothetical protein
MLAGCETRVRFFVVWMPRRGRAVRTLWANCPVQPRYPAERSRSLLDLAASIGQRSPLVRGAGATSANDGGLEVRDGPRAHRINAKTHRAGYAIPNFTVRLTEISAAALYYNDEIYLRQGLGESGE